MAFKLIDANEIKAGTNIVIEKETCTVRSVDISKTGKHGHAKVRMEAIGVFDGKKRVVVVPGSDRFEVPVISKLKGQVLKVYEDKATIMDTESFETMDMMIDPELRGELKEENNVEYWDIEGRKIIKRRI